MSKRKNVNVYDGPTTKSLKPHVECPICMEIPRDGVMLQCLNGHNVCKVCKDKIDQIGNVVVAKCPQGRCDFAIPPTRNFTVANLIEKFPFEWPCKYQSGTGCGFEGTFKELVLHEAECGKQRKVQCPHHLCNEKVFVGSVVEHLENAHKRKASGRRARLNTGISRLLWKPTFRSGMSWAEFPFRLGLVDWALLCSHWQDGQAFFYLWTLLDEDEAAKLECVFTLDHANGTSLVLPGPVYPVNWDKNRIMKDDRCVRLSTWNISRVISDEGVSELYRTEGLSKITVNFRVSRKGI